MRKGVYVEGYKYTWASSFGVGNWSRRQRSVNRPNREIKRYNKERSSLPREHRKGEREWGIVAKGHVVSSNLFVGRFVTRWKALLPTDQSESSFESWTHSFIVWYWVLCWLLCALSLSLKSYCDCIINLDGNGDTTCRRFAAVVDALYSLHITFNQDTTMLFTSK